MQKIIKSNTVTDITSLKSTDLFPDLSQFAHGGRPQSIQDQKRKQEALKQHAFSIFTAFYPLYL